MTILKDLLVRALFKSDKELLLSNLLGVSDWSIISIWSFFSYSKSIFSILPFINTILLCSNPSTNTEVSTLLVDV